MFAARTPRSTRRGSDAGPSRKPHDSFGYSCTACASTSASTPGAITRLPSSHGCCCLAVALMVPRRLRSPHVLFFPLHRREVPVATIAHHGHHAPRLTARTKLPRDPMRREDVGARRMPHVKPLERRELVRHVPTVLGVHVHRAVVDRRVVDR